MIKIATINQPCLFPRMHLFERAAVADYWVHMSSAQFVRNGDQSLFPMRLNGEEVSVRVPTKKGRLTRIVDVVGVDDPRFVRKLMLRLKADYGKLAGFEAGMGYVEFVLKALADDGFAAAGEASVEYCMGVFEIEMESIFRDVDLMVPPVGDPSGWVRELTARSGATVHYAGGVASDKYINKEDWDAHGISFHPQEWTSPDYARDGSLRSLSAFDVIIRGVDAISEVVEDFSVARGRAGYE